MAARRLAAPSGVALVDEGLQLAALEHRRGAQQPARQHVDGADVAVEEVDGVDALAAHLGVEVVAAGGEAAALQDVVERQRDFAHVVRELIGVPAVLRIAAVHVDRAEDAEVDRHGDLVLEAVPGERRVVGFDVDLDLLLEAVVLQEAVDRVDVEIVLMLGRLVRLRLDQDRGP